MQTLQVHRSHDIEGTGQDVVCYVFLVNASSPKLLDVATSNFAGA